MEGVMATQPNGGLVCRGNACAIWAPLLDTKNKSHGKSGKTECQTDVETLGNPASLMVPVNGFDLCHRVKLSIAQYISNRLAYDTFHLRYKQHVHSNPLKAHLTLTLCRLAGRLQLVAVATLCLTNISNRMNTPI